MSRIREGAGGREGRGLLVSRPRGLGGCYEMSWGVWGRSCERSDLRRTVHLLNRHPRRAPLYVNAQGPMVILGRGANLMSEVPLYGTSLIVNRLPVGPNPRPMPRALGWS